MRIIEETDFYYDREALTSKEKNEAMGSYLMMFVSSVISLPIPFINIIASVIYFFIMNSKSPFVKFHALQSMLSQILVSGYNIFTVGITVAKIFLYFEESFALQNNKPYSNIDLTYETYGDLPIFFSNGYKIVLIIYALLNIFYIILSLVATLKASKGKLFIMPLVGNFCMKRTFKKYDE